MSKYIRLILCFVSAMGLIVLFMLFLPAQGRTLDSTQAAIIVNTLEDEDNTDGDCSLREAIRAANENDPVDACPQGDTITDTITFSVAGTITLTEQLSVTAGGPLVIDGEGGVWVNGSGNVRIFYVEAGAELVMDGVLLTAGFANGPGAGIYNLGKLTIARGMIVYNTAVNDGGGGIYNAGEMLIRTMLLWGNQGYCGGAIYNSGTLTLIEGDLGYNSATWGGAICNSETGTLSILNSTLSDNEAISGGGISSSGALTMTNSTLSGNRADENGGGIRNHGMLTINNSTLYGNSAMVSGGGGIFNDPGYGEATLYGSIIANSPSGDNCAGDPISDDGYNLEDTDRCAFDTDTSMSNTDPLLGELDANGGPTLTHAPLVGSPAIDAGDPLNCPATDQRGIARPVDGDEDGEAICDIGSIEYYLRLNQLIVNTLEDEDNQDGDCSLREAIRAANDNQNVDACQGLNWSLTDLITFTVSGTIPLTGQLHVMDGGALIIDGEDKITISGEDSVRIFYLESADIMLDSLILANGYAGDGGGIYNGCCWLTIINSTLVGNSSTWEGGAIYNGFHDLTILNSSLLNNSAASEGGGIYNTEGKLIIADSTLSGNSAGGMSGGGIYNGMNAVLTITRSILANNSTSYVFSAGGAIENVGRLTLSDSILSGNSSAGTGGAIHSDGMLTITNSTLSDNDAGSLGGGIANHSGGSLTLNNSTLVGNSAENGGGLYNIYGTLTLANDTLSANTAITNGGGIYNQDGTIILNNSTLWGNSAGQEAGGIYNEGGIVTVGGSIVASDPSGGNCAGGVISDFGYNIEDADTCGFELANGSMPDTDPMIAPLQDNGGPTLTHALAPDSPAIDTGDPYDCPPTDQRGVLRPIDGDGDGEAICDIGSYEFDSPDVPTTTSLQDLPDPSHPGQAFMVTMQVTATLGVPTGAVTVTVSPGTESCSAELEGGLGECELTLAEPGSYVLHAAYGGVAQFLPSASSEAHTVDPFRSFLPCVSR